MQVRSEVIQEIFVLSVVSVIFRVAIIWYAYNRIIPKLVSHFTGKSIEQVSSTFQPMNVNEAILLYLLCSSLFQA